HRRVAVPRPRSAETASRGANVRRLCRAQVRKPLAWARSTSPTHENAVSEPNTETASNLLDRVVACCARVSDGHQKAARRAGGEAPLSGASDGGQSLVTR